jgi:valyl-tRNA synthetase
MNEMPKAYDPKTVENKWYDFWEKGHYFTADPRSSKPPYCIVIPPPNVTGVLHMGHALVNTLQDILIRWHRMRGDETLWVPGTDHAGISTQTVVERHLMKTLGKRRQDFTREEFLNHVWAWKEENAHQIVRQLKRLGCSCDWSRARFTLDAGNNLAVRTMFKKLYEEDLIYRGDYLVNWDPVSQTAIADDEVEYEERQSFLWYFKYPLQEGSGFVHIATTRPETMLGDTAIAVSPKDPRYAPLIGKKAILPLMNREISILADMTVDPSFGTGMVKVTPAHDPNDYQMGLNHGLPFINIMTPDGRINENGGPFQGLTMEEARQAVVKEMQALGLVEKIEPHLNRVGVSYRSKATIEPYISKQWFVRMSGFARKLRAIVAEGHTKLIPKSWENTYFHWIDNLRDWCISRQLWWGHRIPIWYHRDNPDHVLCYEGEDLPPEVLANPQEWTQDEDVLDTWFSSALWPFATLGWPNHTPELQRFYPNSVLVTGHDILFFWVARMLFMGDYALGKPPFPEVFLHGLIYGKSYWRDAPNGGILYVSLEERQAYEMGKPIPKNVRYKWEKMSKSKGNIIDPLEIIDIYGTDAMRMALCASGPQLREIDLDLRRIEEFKNFANKIWNGARFVLMNLEGDPALSATSFSQGLDENLLALEDRWIFSVLNRTVEDVNKKLENYLFDQAALEAYDFFWKEFCSYYVELSKPTLQGKIGQPQERANKQKILMIVLCQAIRLIHPMAPYITEELFQLLKKRMEGVTLQPDVDPYTAEAIRALQSPACIVAPYPTVVRSADINPQINQTFDLIEQVVYTIRNIRGEVNIPPSTVTDLHIIGPERDPQLQLLKENHPMISALVRTGTIAFHQETPPLGFTCAGIVDKLKIVIPLPEDLHKREKARLEKEQERLRQTVDKTEAQLANTDYVNNAPAELIERNRKTLEQAQHALQEVKSRLDNL